MKKFKTKKINKLVLKSVTCNCCGKDIKDTCSREDEFYADYISINIVFGYFTEIFEDGEFHSCDICEQCYANWIETFKHHPRLK